MFFKILKIANTDKLLPDEWWSGGSMIYTDVRNVIYNFGSKVVAIVGILTKNCKESFILKNIYIVKLQNGKLNRYADSYS